MGDTSDESDSNNDDELYTDAGCYENKDKGPSHKRLLSDGPHSRNLMSAKICYEICTSGATRDRLNYFGTQNKNECFCGEVANLKSYDNSLKRKMSECDKNCMGSEDEKCGSKHNALLYKRNERVYVSDFELLPVQIRENIYKLLKKRKVISNSLVRQIFPSTKVSATLSSSLITTQLPIEDPGFKASSAPKRGNETSTTKDVPTRQATNALAGIGIGVACLILVVICCVIIWRRRLLRKKIRERSNTYRNAEDMSVTGNQTEQRQGHSFSYTELIVYNHNHAYDELQMETNDTINGQTEVLDNSEGDRVSNDNYTVLVVPEDQNSTLVTHTTEFIENISDNKASNKTNPTIGAYAILDPNETGFDRTKPEQEIKADSYAVLDPAETGFDRTKDKDEVPIQLVKHENWDKALHATTNTETRDDMKNQNGGAHSITTKNKIESIENKADKKASKKTNIGIGAYAILDPDATDFNRTKPKPKVNDDSYTVLDPDETGFDRTKYRDDMPSQSVNIKNSGKAILGRDIQNEITNGEGNHSLNMDGQYDLLNQVCRPKDDNEHTYSHSVEEVYDVTNQNRTLRIDDSLNAYDHFIGSKTTDDNNDKTAVNNG